MPDRPGHRVQCRRNRALRPTRRPGNIIAGEKNPTLMRRQSILHKMAEQPPLVPIMPRQIGLGTRPMKLGSDLHETVIGEPMICSEIFTFG